MTLDLIVYFVDIHECIYEYLNVHVAFVMRSWLKKWVLRQRCYIQFKQFMKEIIFFDYVTRYIENNI